MSSPLHNQFDLFNENDPEEEDKEMVNALSEVEDRIWFEAKAKYAILPSTPS